MPKLLFFWWVLWSMFQFTAYVQWQSVQVLGPSTRISTWVSCLISSLLPVENPQPSIRENSISWRPPVEKGPCWQCFFLIICTSALGLSWVDPWNHLKQVLKVLLELRATVVLLADIAGSSGLSLSLSFCSCCWVRGGGLEEGFGGRSSRLHKCPAALPTVCYRLLLRFRFALIPQVGSQA